ncbi:carbohydrate porin [Erythrobacter sp. THAF29]|uniref:carbohydrate porin n=1 Tax=Erythrobacter sp. THAF29 TaxID=2587851 RepID=UPI001267C9F8|nr:carbohydrate porin [Erythrobacter sp. THAF29]QFT76542.1 Carbohydrate-selective porin, OprB family [Erythrobacter sp. THAF29]
MTVARGSKLRKRALRCACSSTATALACFFAIPANAVETSDTLASAFDSEFSSRANSAQADRIIIADERRPQSGEEQPVLPEPDVPDEAAAGPVKARLVVSQFLDVPVSGGANDTLRYSGRADAYIDAGLGDGWTLTFRPEFTWGEDSNGVIGLIPNNTALFRGENAGDFDLSVNVTKRWNSGTSLTVGKVNVLDLGGQLPVVGSDGHRGFQNLSFALPPSAIIPNTITGALLTVPTDDALFRLWVFDPDSQYERTGFETAFESGVGFLGSVTVPVKIGGAPGYYALKLSGSTRDEISSSNLPAVLIPAPGSGFGMDQGEFAAVLAAYQFLEVYPEHPGKGWGFFGQVYASMGDPTFLDKSGFFGISGNPRGRPQDRFGAGYFRYSLTDSLVTALANRVALEDEEGVEVFYTVGIADRFELTANAQVIDSAIAVRDTGVLAGLRLTTTF